jgi:hypothetical protein
MIGVKRFQAAVLNFLGISVKTFIEIIGSEINFVIAIHYHIRANIN